MRLIHNVAATKAHLDKPRSRIRRGLFRGSRDRQFGAALIEGAIVFPLFSLLVLGLMDGCWALYSQHVMDGSVMAGSRTAATLANETLTDYEVLQSVKKQAGPLGSDSIVRIIVYRSTDKGGPPPAGCQLSSILNTCNSYSGNALTATNVSFGCNSTTDLDLMWCPSTRKTTLKAGGIQPDFIGVSVTLKRKKIIGIIIRNDADIEGHSVIRIEPRQTT